MKRTIRLLAAPAAAVLLLSACSGGADEAAPADPTSVEQEADADADADESEAWPIVEDEDGNIVENPEDEAVPDGEPVDAPTDEMGNQTGIFWDGEELTFDMDAVINGKYPTSGQYYLEGMTGVRIVAELDTDGPAPLEGLRESYGAEPVSYISFDVDNREGSEEILVLELNMYDAEGNEYTFETITSMTNEWSDDAGYRVTEEQEALHEEIDELGESANVGQRTEQWLVGPADLPDEIAHIEAHAEVFADEFYPLPVE